MPHGFIGKPSRSYLQAVENALTAAINVHSRNPFANLTRRDVAPPPVPVRNNHRAPHAPSEAMTGGFVTGIGNRSNIVVDFDTYSRTLQKIQATDEKTCEVLYEVALQIQEMCDTVFMLPRTRGRFLSILDRIKNSLSSFRMLTGDIEGNTRAFNADIDVIG